MGACRLPARIGNRAHLGGDGRDKGTFVTHKLQRRDDTWSSVPAVTVRAARWALVPLPVVTVIGVMLR